MKALKWYGIGDLRLEDVSEPSPKAGEVKVKVKLAGICGSDLHEYEMGPVFVDLGSSDSITLGHEFAGDVVEVGAGVDNLKVGDRVAGDAPQYCGSCYFCRRNMLQLCQNGVYTGLHVDGAFAEYVVVPAYTCYPLPDDVSYELGAVIEPLEVATHAISKAGVKLGDTVAIVGAGTIGLSVLLLARAAGAAKIYVLELIKERGERAVAMGAAKHLNPNEVNAPETLKELTNGLGVDVAFDCAGTAISGPLAISLARRAGTIAIVGMSYQPTPDFQWVNFMLNDQKFVGCIGYAHDAYAILDLLADGRIDPTPMITNKVSLKDAEEKGFKAMIHHPEKEVKILVQP